jgi:hypothetical protein
MSRQMLENVKRQNDPRQEVSLKTLSKVWYSYIRMFNIRV